MRGDKIVIKSKRICLLRGARAVQYNAAEGKRKSPRLPRNREQPNGRAPPSKGHRAVFSTRASAVLAGGSARAGVSFLHSSKTHLSGGFNEDTALPQLQQSRARLLPLRSVARPRRAARRLGPSRAGAVAVGPAENRPAENGTAEARGGAAGRPDGQARAEKLRPGGERSREFFRARRAAGRPRRAGHS